MINEITLLPYNLLCSYFRFHSHTSLLELRQTSSFWSAHRDFRFQAFFRPPSLTMSHHRRTYLNPYASDRPDQKLLRCHCCTSCGGLNEQSSFSCSTLVEFCKQYRWFCSRRCMELPSQVTTSSNGNVSPITLWEFYEMICSKVNLTMLYKCIHTKSQKKVKIDNTTNLLLGL